MIAPLRRIPGGRRRRIRVVLQANGAMSPPSEIPVPGFVEVTVGIPTAEGGTLEIPVRVYLEDPDAQEHDGPGLFLPGRPTDPPPPPAPPAPAAPPPGPRPA